MSKTVRSKNPRHKKMKSLLEDAHLPSVMKQSTSAVAYWSRVKQEKPFVREDGTVGKDKTFGLHSRPGSKEKARNANRAMKKRARQHLKMEIKQDECNG
jgi:hypothetical protein